MILRNVLSQFFIVKYYFTHRNVSSQFKNNLCKKAKADARTPNSRQGDIHYNRNGRFHTRDGLFV